jgi:polysaccharide biosynthesis protein PslG
MDTIRSTRRILLIALLGVLLLFACTPQEPILIIITPTPDPDAATATPVPTLEVQEQQEQPQEPTDTATVVTPVEPTPEGTQFGPITREDYILPTLPPPEIEIPTVTPTPPAPTAIPVDTETPGPTPTPLPNLDPSQMGIQVYWNLEFEDFISVVHQVETTGVGWIKIQVNWAFIQPEGPNTFGERFQLFERQVEAAARPHDVRVMLSIAKAPNWARSDLTESGPPDNPQDLADFLTFMLNETKIGQSIDAIEIWNEPNLIREWRGTLPFSGGGYMQIFGPAYDAVRAYSPDMAIITAGLAPTGSIDGATINDRTYLQQMYDAGLGNYQDPNLGIGVHPYGWGNPPDARCCASERGWDDNPQFYFLDNIEDMHDIMVRNGHQNQRLWVTEFGWATWEGLPNDPPEVWMTFNTAQDQANYAIRAFEIGQERPYIGPMMLWNLNFANVVTVEQRQEISGYSIVNPVLFPSERPLFNMLAEVTDDENTR